MLFTHLSFERFTRILAPAIANRERGSLRERVEGVWLALGGRARALKRLAGFSLPW